MTPPLPQGRQILVVDDEPTLRLGFAYAITDASTLVETAASGREALEKLEHKKYDLIILDLRMPDVDGFGVIEVMRKAEIPTPIVLCSAALTAKSALRAIHFHVVDFLLKPVKPVDLREVIDFVLETPSQPFSLAMACAREGDFCRAFYELKKDLGPAKRSQAWLEMFSYLQRDSTEVEANNAGDRGNSFTPDVVALAFQA